MFSHESGSFVIASASDRPAKTSARSLWRPLVRPE